MFVNRCKNKSGTVSVCVLQIRGRNNVLVKSFSSSSDVKEIERLLKAANSDLTINKAREFVKTIYALTYTKNGHTKQSKSELHMDQELYRLVNEWVNRNLGNA